MTPYQTHNFYLSEVGIGRLKRCLTLCRGVCPSINCSDCLGNMDECDLAPIVIKLTELEYIRRCRNDNS